MIKKVSILILIFSLLAAPAFAAIDFKASPWTTKTGCVDKAVGKLGFGLKNLILGWTELFTEPYQQKSLAGAGEGLFNTVADTVGGALHVVTFFLPIDVKLPQGGVDII